MKVWIFTFEYVGILKVGGLGEVPANQAKSLKDELDITIFMPSHGKKDNFQSSSNIFDLGLNFTGDFIPYEFDIHISHAKYDISLHKVEVNGINVILVSGNNEISKKILEDPRVYSPESLSGKIGLFSYAIRHYVEYLIENNPNLLPDIVHIHDYHPFIAFIAMKQELLKHDLNIPSIITFHLLTWPRKNKRFLKACGIDDTSLLIWLDNEKKKLSFEEIFELARNNERMNPSLEKICALIADIITSVSKSYLESDVIPNLGGDLIFPKSDFVWDGCDWDYDEIITEIKNKFSKEIINFAGITDYSKISRWDMRRFLLKFKIENIPKNEPIITSKIVLKVVNSINGVYPILQDRKVKAFNEDGPLILTSGRISHQKGIDTILKSIPLVIEKVPKARFLMLLMPNEYTLEDVKSYAKFMKIHPQNLRILFGKSISIYHLAHICADLYCCPSRWEPFGIIALEAMSSKIPVIATKVGGFQESIIDLNNDLENGTGILVKKENPEELANALVSMLITSEICRIKKTKDLIPKSELNLMVHDIFYPALRKRVIEDNLYYDKIKENCLKRVEENFRWKIVSKKLLSLYNKSKKLIKNN